MGIAREFIVKRSSVYKTKWVFTITYADHIGGEIVWRLYPNYVSEYFKTKKAATAEMLVVVNRNQF